MAAHSAPKEDSKEEAASFHTAMGMGALEGVPTANAVLWRAWGWGRMSPLGNFGSLEKYFRGILNPDRFSYEESKCVFLCG